MDFKPIRIAFVLLSTFILLILSTLSAEAAVVKKGDRTYLVDRTGELWDISQAVSIGYDANKFEYGIGRHAFQPLDNSHWNAKSKDTASGIRIIGVAGNGDAHAYSVGKLRYHETANTMLGTQAIVAGY